MNIDEAIVTIEKVSGFDDRTSMVGEAWKTVKTELVKATMPCCPSCHSTDFKACCNSCGTDFGDADE